MAKIIKRNVTLAEEGTWVNNIMGDICVKIAADNNTKYTTEIQRLMRPYQKNYKTMGDSFNALFEDMQNKAAAKAILLDWKNLEDDKGIVKYSEQAAYEMLKDPENLEFRKIIFDLAGEAEVFRKEVEQDLADKSK